MIDTHCHLTSESLHHQLDAVIARAHEAGVDRMITVATSLDDAKIAIELSHRIDCVYATAGIHPHEAQGQFDKQAVIEQVRLLACDPNVVAIGEIGLDSYYPDPPMADQRRLFAWQLEAAGTSTKPVVIHNREATNEVLKMIGDSPITGERFVFHCFTGKRDELEAILELGAMVSFTGITTFNSAKAIAQCAKRVPLDRIMVETDSPYLSPEPYRKVRPNEPCYVPWVARFIAKVREMDENQFIQAVDCNADRFFNLR